MDLVVQLASQKYAYGRRISLLADSVTHGKFMPQEKIREGFTTFLAKDGISLDAFVQADFLLSLPEALENVEARVSIHCDH